MPPSDDGPDQPSALRAGRMIIEAIDNGSGVIVPEVSFEPVGRISPGWFERHQTHFLRHIQRAQVAQRTGIERRLYNENGARQ